MKNWVPWASTDPEVRDFMDACHGVPEHPILVAPWPVRFLARGAYDPSSEGHSEFIAWLFLYRWTLEPETRRELAFQRTLAFQPKPRVLTLDEYLLVAGDMRLGKQHGLTRMLRRGDISPERFRELNELLVQAFPDKLAYNW